jgi:hypothetical protein
MENQSLTAQSPEDQNSHSSPESSTLPPPNLVPFKHDHTANSDSSGTVPDSQKTSSPKTPTQTTRTTPETTAKKAPKPFPDATTLRQLLHPSKSIKNTLTHAIDQFLNHHRLRVAQTDLQTIDRDLVPLNCYGPSCEIQFIPGNLVQIDLGSKIRNQALKKALIAETISLQANQDLPALSLLTYLENLGRILNLFHTLQTDTPHPNPTILKLEIIAHGILALIECSIEAAHPINLSQLQTASTTSEPGLPDALRNEYTALFKRLLLEQNQPPALTNSKLQLTASNLTNTEALQLALSLLPDPSKRRTKPQNLQRLQQLRNNFETTKSLRKPGEGTHSDQVLCDLFSEDAESFFLFARGKLSRIIPDIKPTSEPTGTLAPSQPKPSPQPQASLQPCQPASDQEHSSNPTSLSAPKTNNFPHANSSTFYLREESAFYKFLCDQYHWIVVLIIVAATISIIRFFLNAPPETNPLNRIIPHETTTPGDPQSPNPLAPPSPNATKPPQQSAPSGIPSAPSGQNPTSIEWK